MDGQTDIPGESSQNFEEIKYLNKSASVEQVDEFSNTEERELNPGTASIFYARRSDSNVESSDTVKSDSQKTRLDLGEVLSNSSSEAEVFHSPSDFISEEAIRRTMELISLDNPNDTGMGPGRVRKFADQDPDSNEWKDHSKHFFVLSSAGKPIYSRFGDENKLSSFMGIIQALISMFQDTDDTLRCINSGNLRIVFLVKGPLYFVLCSTLAEPELVLRDQLHWVYNQIVSIITTTQITKIFEKHRNYDLRRLLGGTEPFLDHLCDSLGEPRYFLSGIRCIRMSSQLRSSIGNALQVCTSISKSILYGMLIVRDQLITILRPKRHSFHPSDLHLIFNMVNSSNSFKAVPESWMPICLPKFNDKGFLHTYVSYITPSYPGPAADICLVLVSNDRDKFFEMSECRQAIVQHMTSSGSLFLLQEAVRNSEYKIDDVGIPGLRHFIYKSKSNIQFTMPLFGSPYLEDVNYQARILLQYQVARSQMLARSKQLKTLYVSSDNETILGWNTNSFEIYALFGPLVTKSNATSALNSLVRWIRAEEDSLFIMHVPTFS